jgi:signal transduction histidine kinase/CheY-like chemotaxis protein
VSLQNADSVLIARQRAEAALLKTTEQLERRTQELAHSLSMMRATLESTTDAILVTDAQGTVTDCNEKFLAMWRIPRTLIATREHRKLLEHICAQFTDPDDGHDRIEAIHRGSPAETADILELADGRVFERFSKIQFLAQANVGRVWSFRDITTQRRTEEALRDESRILELLNETGRVIASQLELPTLMQAVTDAATKLSGAWFGAFFTTTDDATDSPTPDAGGEVIPRYTFSGAPREAFAYLGHPAAATRFGATFRDAAIGCDDAAAGSRGRTAAPRFGMPMSLPVHSYLAIPVTSRSGHVLGGLFFGHPEAGVFTPRAERLIAGVAAQAAVAIDNARLFDGVRRAAKDRAARLEAERTARAEVERVSVMKDEFLATLSHELRTPLTSVLGWSQILLAGDHTPADLRQGLETIAQSARAQAQLIEDLLDMSRIVAGKVRLDVQRTELAGIIDAAVDAVKPSVDAKAIRLFKLVDPQAGSVIADPNRLQQVVWNLLSNAVKFTPRGGRIHVLVARVEAQVEITVRDTGPGISPDFLPQVFERFRQADASITRKHGGLGLGLAIVKQLVELHGGTVRVDNDAAGQGAIFVVNLPLGAPRDEADPRPRRATDPAPAPREASHLAGAKIVVVDDDLDARELLKWVLENAKAEVVVGTSAAEGLELIKSHRPDLVISDIGMPERDGYQLIRDVRSLPADGGGQTPAIALTAFARSEDRTRALLAGYQIHLAKPIEPRKLVAMVKSLLGAATA